MAVLHRSTFDRLTVLGAGAPVVQGFFRVDLQFAPDLEALALDAQVKHDTLHGVDGRALVLHPGWSAAVQAARVASVGGNLGGRQVIQCPQTTAAVRVRLILGSIFLKSRLPLRWPHYNLDTTAGSTTELLRISPGTP